MQTWKIKGQVYTRSQLQELKRQGLDPRKDDIVMKFVTVTNSGEPVAEIQTAVETEKEEFARLKLERAWKSADKKDRYNELKAKYSEAKSNNP